ncbi:unnamed protein product [Brachionus calyciflorus]|uniref:Uncharacterized protein n=1 Tax=Brachionus calyciflorus TaxID=104777 RepID=A0A813UJU1_9BILA|nr:unnamed protein product [Brachionus calyciflorus]
MSFYVTLPSYSSMDLYPENTMTDFPVELTYKHSWSLEVGQLFIQPLNSPNYDVFKFVYHDGENIKSFTSRLNGEIWKFYINKENERRLELGKSNKEIPQNIKIPKNPFTKSKWYEMTGEKSYLESGIINDPSPNIINSLFIYCDIIDYQYVGDAYAPLLRSVVVDNSYLKTAGVKGEVESQTKI